VTLDLAFVNFVLVCNLDGGVMGSPRRREIVSLVFTCLGNHSRLFALHQDYDTNSVLDIRENIRWNSAYLCFEFVCLYNFNYTMRPPRGPGTIGVLIGPRLHLHVGVTRGTL